MITAFGDSIVKGVLLQSNPDGTHEYGVSNESIVDLCGRKLGISTLNYARFACTAPLGERMVERYESRLNPEQIVLIGYGGNDSDYNWSAIAAHPEEEHHPRTNLTEYVNAYTHMIQRVRSAGAIPVLLSMPPMDGEKYFQFFSKYWTEEEKENVLKWLGGSTTHITTSHELYNITTWKIAQEQHVPMIDITTDFLNRRDYPTYLCEDGVHPNKKGQERIADLIVEQLHEYDLPLAG